MAEIIMCPACQRKLQVPDSYSGQTVQCPECAHRFVADPHAQSVQKAPAPSVPAPAPQADTPPPENRHRRKREYDDDSRDDFDDAFDDLRPLRKSGVPNRGGLVLALGIISLVGGMSFFLPFVMGPIAWLLGNADLSAIRAGRMDPSGEGMIQAGRILGMISTFLMIAIFVSVCGIVLIIMSHG